MRIDGDWEGWLGFFLDGIAESADQAISTTRALTTTFADDRGRIERKIRAAGSTLRVHTALQRHPILSIGRAAKETGLTIPTVGAALDALVRLGIVEELTGKKRGRLYGYAKYLRILTDGADASRGRRWWPCLAPLARAAVARALPSFAEVPTASIVRH